MIPIQEQRIRNKITRIRKALAAEKRQWGGYHDGGGLRYAPPELFVKLKDYKGGLRYLQWFARTFPDDIGHPVFLFEWTLILFKTGKTKDAVRKAYQTFMENTYIFDKFLGKEFLRFDKMESSDWAKESLAEYFQYSASAPELIDFAAWLKAILTSEQFYKLANEFIDIEARLKEEPVGPDRSALVQRLSSLLDEY